MRKGVEDCLFIGGPRDGQWHETDTGQSSIRPTDPIFPMSLREARHENVSETVAVTSTVYLREVLRTGDRIWYVYIAEEIGREKVIPQLLTGYRRG